MPYHQPLSGRKLDIAYWYVTHKIQIKKIISIVLLVVVGLLFFYYVYVLVNNLVLNNDSYKFQVRQLATINPDYAFLRQAKLTQEIKVVEINTYVNRDNQYDIVAEISNNKPDWWATFSYQFQVGETLTEKRQSFILPSQTKYITNLAVENGGGVSNVVFSDIVWQKEINYQELAENRLRLETQNVEFIPSQALGIGDEVNISRVRFDLFNNSAYNYNNVQILIFLRAGAEVVAVNQASSGIIRSAETKEIEVTFFQRLPKITGVDINLEVNILDEDVYLQF